MIQKIFSCFLIFSALSNLVPAEAQYQRELDSLHAVLETELSDQDLANTYMDIGYFHLRSSDYPKSLEFYSKSLPILKEIGDKEGLSINYNNLGIIAYNMGNYLQALNYHQESLRLKEELGNNYGIADAYTNLGLISYDQGDYEIALDYYSKSLVLQEELGEESGISACYNNMALIYKIQGNTQAARDYLRKAIDINKKTSDRRNLAENYYNLGEVLLSQNQLDSGRYYARKGLVLAKNVDFKLGIIRANYVLGKYYLKLAAYPTAIPYFENGISLALKGNMLEEAKKGFEQSYIVYKALHEYPEALAAHEQYLILKDSMLNETNTRKLVQKEMEYQFNKEKQESVLAQQKDLAVQHEKFLRQQQLIHSLTICTIAIIFIAIFAYRAYKIKKNSNQALTKQNDKIRQQKDELEELDQFKSRFFANITHELRTPLTLISSPVEVLLADENITLSAKAIQTIGLIQRNTKKLQGLVNDILDLSKIESKNIEIIEESVQVKPFIDRVASNFDSMTQHLGLQYVKSTNVSEEALVLLDIRKMEKVINNLLSNAIKYTPSGGQVSFDCRKESDQLVLSVSDTGPGIVEQDLPHVFNRYFQSKQPDTPLQGGTGIGLALAKELTILMNGELIVASEPGRGTTFTLTLPYKSAASSTGKVVPSKIDGSTEVEESLMDDLDQNRPRQTNHILIVEDNLDMQTYLKGLLVNNYHIQVATNGRVALEILKNHTIDLIISDVMMPEVDGYTMLKHLKASDEFRSLPVIMLTALDFEEHKVQALSIGVDDYLTKPFSATELLARVNNLITRSQLRQQWIETEQMQEEAEPKKVHRADLEWLNSVEIVIQEHLEDNSYRISDLANHFHLSERQFHRRIKKITGLNPKQYQQEIALQRAREIIEKGEFGNISAVAYSVGMNNVSRFSNLYLGRFGKKPLAYFEELQSPKD